MEGYYDASTHSYSENATVCDVLNDFVWWLKRRYYASDVVVMQFLYSSLFLPRHIVISVNVLINVTVWDVFNDLLILALVQDRCCCSCLCIDFLLMLPLNSGFVGSTSTWTQRCPFDESVRDNPGRGRH